MFAGDLCAPPSQNQRICSACHGGRNVFDSPIPGNQPGSTLFMLFVLQPTLNLSVAGVVLHVIQVPYRVLNWTPVVWLGRISYSLYLWQEAFCSNPAQHHWYSLTLATLVCASVSYYCVEQPMLRLREKWTRKSESERSPALEPNSLPA